jgi:hypothetical protein
VIASAGFVGFGIRRCFYNQDLVFCDSLVHGFGFKVGYGSTTMVWLLVFLASVIAWPRAHVKLMAVWVMKLVVLPFLPFSSNAHTAVPLGISPL